MANSPNYNWPEPDNTDLVKNGALAMRTLGDAIDTTMATMTPKSIVDAKGDLIAASAADTPTRLAVGNNGETLVADSSTATGLRYQGNPAAGKNKIINGDFGVWQRGTTWTDPAFGTYTSDRYYVGNDGTGSKTFSRQTFTAGTAPVSGYEATYFFRANQTTAGSGGTYSIFGQKIEDVRTFAGQTVTLSFWAKSAGTSSFAVTLRQDFGSGGSSVVDTTIIASTATTTGWVRYTGTVSVPSISGKTIATGSSLTVLFSLPINTTYTLDFWGVQLEAGSVATAFQTASGSIGGELALCQRYYEKSYDLATAPATAVETGSFGFCIGTNSTAANYFTYAPVFKVAKRGTPTITLYDLSGNSGKVNKVSATDLSMTANQTATADRIGETEFRIYSALNTAGGFYGHYVASAEL